MFTRGFEMGKNEIITEKIAIPKGAKITLQDKIATVKGPKGELVKDFTHARKIKMEIHDNEVILTALYPRKKDKALIGTLKSLINNMFLGVLDGPFVTKMKIVYSHFPITVKVQENQVLIENFLGERAARIVQILEKNVKVRVDNDDVIVESIDKASVGQMAANIRRATKIKNKDPRTFQDGIYSYQKLLADKEIWSLKF